MINQKKLIEEMGKLKQEVNMPVDIVWNNLLKVCIDTVNEQPKVGEWIPCSSGVMPEDMKEVLVWFEYFRYGEYNRLYRTIGISWAIHGEWSMLVNGQSGWRALKIIAWQPLPEPYKGE